MSGTIVGGWSPFRKPTAEDMKVFDEAMKGMVGVDYEPISVSTQVVAGMNYRFVCHATPVYPDAVTRLVEVTIYAPINAQPHVMSITPLLQ